jgi:hypothetical protein
MKNRNAPANKGNHLVSFTHQDAQRINASVTATERARRGRNPSSLPRATGGGGGGGGQMATFTGQWFKGQEKVVTLMIGTNAASTTRCSNFIVDVLYSDAARFCFVTPFDPPGYTLMIPECIR